ncbi:MAG: MBOAT family protein [Bacteroidales bacterium]|nr:MBOAT family protein [Bacteroidales bacterium]
MVFFKYLSFIITGLLSFFNFFGFSNNFHTNNILIPIGISYYTFQGIGYILQVYREHEKAERNIFIFSNYFLFFPKFLSGPIELSKTFIPQLKSVQNFKWENIQEGVQLILWGAFKKLVIADRLYVIINSAYPNIGQYSGNTLFVTFLLQPLLLYCNFSGYTDIALGVGRTFGFKLTDNFNRPFFSPSVTQFWRRWHISLSNWCNEFIFKRLSFKMRKWGSWSGFFAVFITFLVIGIWHGASWKFVVLGLLQGIAINYEFFTKKYRLQIASKFPSYLVTSFSCLATYLFFCLSLTFFYANSLSDALYFISKLFINVNFSTLTLPFITDIDKVIILISLLIVFVVDFIQEQGIKEIKAWWAFPAIIIFLFFVLLINFVTSVTSTPFIYTLF